MLTPLQITRKYVEIGKQKAEMPIINVFLLSVFAGMFIALAGTGATIASATVASPSLAKLISAFIFPTGLIMILLTGSELFTGNSLIIISVLDKKVKISAMIINWIVVYLGNLVGSLFYVFLFVYSHTPDMMDQALAYSLVNIAQTKLAISPMDAFLRGILCNILVCMAVFVTVAATSAQGKIISLYMPVVVFVLCGFEHCVANMFYIPAGMLCSLEYGIPANGMNMVNFWIHNMIPVTLGNIIGGAGIIGLGYWFVYLRHDEVVNED